MSNKQKSTKPRRPISQDEQARRAQQRAQSVQQLLYTRAQTCRVLGGISIATVIRLENKGVLDKVRLFGSDVGEVFHRVSQVHALAEGSDHVE